MTFHRLVDSGEDLDEIDVEDVPADERWTLALDTDGDLRFDDRSKRLLDTSGVHAVTQSFKVALASVKGEDPIDPEFGLDVFAATRSTAHLEREIRRTLDHDDYRHDRVESIDDVTIIRDLGSRRAHVDISLTLDTGTTGVIRLDTPFIT